MKKVKRLNRVKGRMGLKGVKGMKLVNGVKQVKGMKMVKGVKGGEGHLMDQLGEHMHWQLSASREYRFKKKYILDNPFCNF